MKLPHQGIPDADAAEIMRLADEYAEAAVGDDNAYPENATAKHEKLLDARAALERAITSALADSGLN